MKKHLDGGQLRTQATALAEAWLIHAPTENGFFRTRFNALWEPLPGNNKVSLVSQSRMIYVLAAGYDLSGDPRYLAAARAGADFMLESMRNRETGGWYRAVDAEGRPVERGVHPYGYSFVVFGLAHAYRVTGDRAYLSAAIDTWRSGVWPGLEEARRSNDQPVSARAVSLPQGAVWSQNPYMHLFEALLALHEASDMPEVWSDIEAMAAFTEERLIQPCGCLPELYDAETFTPLDDAAGGQVIIGHQVEWASFLRQAVDRGLDQRYAGLAEGLLDFAIAYGVDRDNGALLGQSDQHGVIRNTARWWWAQAELMRATTAFAARERRADLWPIHQAASDYALIHHIDPVHGGWTFESFIESGKGLATLEKAIGYHAMAYYLEALSHVPER